MTWLSRLLPQSPSLQRRATSVRNNRTRQSKGFRALRRQSSLEQLESRQLLNGNMSAGLGAFTPYLASLASPPALNTLSVYGDVNSINNITITENANATVTVKNSGMGLAQTSINNNSSQNASYTTPVGQPVGKIQVFWTGTVGKQGPGQETVTINSNEAKATAPSTVCVTENDGNMDTITVTGVSGSSLSLAQGNGCNDTITVTNSQFTQTTTCQGNGSNDTTSLLGGSYGTTSVTQGNGCNDTVYLDTPAVTSNFAGVNVCQGSGNQDGVNVSNTKATSMCIKQASNCLGDDYVDITNLNMSGGTLSGLLGSTYTGLQVTQGSISGPSLAQWLQGLSATPDSVTINGIISPSISVSQGKGCGDSVTITGFNVNKGITVCQDSGDSNSVLIESGTAGCITVTQGNGCNDTAGVEMATVTGEIIVSQGCGHNDFITVSGDIAGSICTTQGDGNNDTTDLLADTVKGDVNVHQGNGNCDVVDIDGAYNSDGSIGAAFTANNIYICVGGGSFDTITVNNVDLNLQLNPDGSTFNPCYGNLDVTVTGIPNCKVGGQDNIYITNISEALCIDVCLSTPCENYVDLQNVITGNLTVNVGNSDGNVVEAGNDTILFNPGLLVGNYSNPATNSFWDDGGNDPASGNALSQGFAFQGNWIL